MSMNVGRYLERIGIPRREAPNLAFLQRLQVQHLLSVPFENLDIRAGRRIVLDLGPLYEKIVGRRRGGFCYELNGLFGWLLGELGYDVTMISARAYNRDKETFGPEFDHMALLVDFGETYLADVGFGDCFRTPIRLPSGSTKDVSGSYRIRLRPDQSQAGTLEKNLEGHWRPAYRFTLIPRTLSEYVSMCEYHQTSPNTHFTQRSICTMATETGRISLSGDSLTITNGITKQRIPIESAQQYRQMLVDHFGITWDQASIACLQKSV